MEVLTSLKALRNHMDPSQLPEALEGPFPYQHSAWVQFFQVSTLLLSPSPTCPMGPSTLPKKTEFKNRQSFNKQQTVIQQTFTMKVQSSPSKALGQLAGIQSCSAL